MTPQSGDLVFVHGRGFIDWAIRAAEWVRRPWRKGCHWNHVAIVDAPGNRPPTLVQALGQGVVAGQPLGDLAPGTYAVVPLPPQFTRSKVVAFAKAQTGKPYGFFTIASVLFTLFTPRFLNVLLPGTWICSALGAEAWRFAGWYHDWPDVYQVSPAQLWVATTTTEQTKGNPNG